MSVLILQLGDIHIHSSSDWILAASSKIAAAAAAEADSNVDTCCILMTGDAVQSATKDEFDLASHFLKSINQDMATRLKCPVEIITIPGNHDLHLADDQTARNQLIDGIATATQPATSVLDIVLPTQRNYFDFAEAIASPGRTLTYDKPFFRTVRIDSPNGAIDLHLVNTAWMCRRGQGPGALLFPLETFDVDTTTSPAYSIAVLHHPFNWFSQPSTMRPLRDKVEHSSDMIITGHEHNNAAFSKHPLGTLGVLQYLEGGVLQERGDSTISSFAILSFDFKQQEQRICRFISNSEGIYLRQPGSDNTPLRVNISRKDRRFQISPVFREFLDDPDLPLADSKQRAIRLLDIFTYPDLKEATDPAVATQWTCIKGDKVLAMLLRRTRVLIAGSPKSGKTSLAKSLFADLLGNGRLPVYLDGIEMKDVITDAVARKALNSAIKQQYADCDVEAYEQAANGKRALIIDNLDAIDDSLGAREHLLNFIDGRFDLVIVFADDEFVVEHFHARRGSARKIVNYDYFHICEFGYLRIEDLARRWLSCSRPAGSSAREDDVRQICKTVGRVLQINAIPHHPWILIVLLQEASSGQEIVAKNGSYGHLFQAIVTSALYRSQLHDIDIETKYVYLAELAYAMYSRSLAIFDEAEARAFHSGHCDRYDLDLDFKKTIDDLVYVNIVRIDAGRIAFRTKYSYWFFVAWHISRHMHDALVQTTLLRLCKGLHHEDTANIFVFLAHLSNDPQVLKSIIGTAKTLFDTSPLANLDEDVKVLNLLQREEFVVRLPNSDPEQNRLRMMEESDEVIIQRDGAAMDGRRIEATAPPLGDVSVDDFTTYIRTLQASVKTIDILGQVLRNGAGSIPASEKREIVDEIYRLARRIIGTLLRDLPNQLQGWCEALWKHFLDKYPQDTADIRVDRVLNQVTHTMWFVTFAIVRRVSQSLAHEMLRKTFDKAIAAEFSIPNRLFDLSIKLDVAKGFPANEAETMYKDVFGNMLVRAVVRALVVNHLYLYKVPHNELQAICSKLEIELDEEALDPAPKKVKGLLTSLDGKSRSEKRDDDRKRRKDERKRRRK